MFKLFAAIVAVGLTFCCAVSSAQTAGAPPASPIKRTILQRADVPNTSLEMIYAVVEINPNFRAGRHNHPGVVMAQVIDGEFWLQLDGQPEQVLRPGEVLTLPDRVVHNEGATDKPVKLNVVYLVEKGKPLASPAQ
jgi:quercetin dioxygenase-like cupin family protein